MFSSSIFFLESPSASYIQSHWRLRFVPWWADYFHVLLVCTNWWKTETFIIGSSRACKTYCPFPDRSCIYNVQWRFQSKILVQETWIWLVKLYSWMYSFSIMSLNYCQTIYYNVSFINFDNEEIFRYQIKISWIAVLIC